MFSSLVPRKPGTEPLARALKACSTHFVWAAIFSALVNILYLAPTLYMMQVYDRVVPTGGLVTLALVTAVAMFALATLAVLDWLRTRLLLRASLRLDNLLAAAILNRLLGAPSAHSPTQALREFDNVRSALSGQAVLALFDAPWTPLYLACCFLLHPAIGVLTLVGGTILFILAVLNERDSRPRLKRAIGSSVAAYAAHDGLGGQSEVVRALGMRKATIQRQIGYRATATHQYADAQLNGGKYSGVIKFLRLAMQSLALGLAAWLVVDQQISAGSIIAASVLLSRAVSPIEQLVGNWPTLIQVRSSWTTLIELFTSTAEAERERTTLPAPAGKLEIQGVSVKLPNTERPQLRNVSLTLLPGQTLGVIGASGSGKTTLARVIAGALAPNAGAIRLDGAEYSLRDSEELARYIGYLPQNPTLFAGTVKENISRFAQSAGAGATDVDAAAVAAARAAGAHDMILRLPLGYDTGLGTSGQGVSAGQAQRIALARALYRNPALLILDEPNSSLDQEGEAALMGAILAAAARKASVVIIAHRAGVLSRVDRLAMMREGAIDLEGPREEVLSKIRSTAPAIAVRPQ